MAGTNWQQLSGGSTNPWTIRRDDGTPTANYSDHIICDGGTVILPAPQANEAVLVSNISATTEIVPNGTETIEGETSITYDQNNPIAFVSDGVNWYVSNNLNYVGAAPDSVVLPESGDMQYFDGDTDQMDILDTTQDSAINDGPYRDLALMENNNGDNMRNDALIISKSGLNTYPSAGQTFTWIQAEPDYSYDNGAMATFFGVQNSSNWYGAGLGPSDKFYLVKDEVKQMSASPPIDPGVWYEIEVDWASDGTISGKIFEISQSDGTRISELASISFTDSEYSSGGIGVGNKGATGGGYAMQKFRVD